MRNVYYDTGNTKMVLKYYSLDTVAHGAEIHYGFNDKITKWMWWDKKFKYVQYAVYFDTNQVYQYQKGMPFLNAINAGNDALGVEVVNPPINYLVGYRDFKDGNIVRKMLKEPGKTDSTAWITIPNHKFENDHQYIVYFYVVDSNDSILDSISQDLKP